MKALESGKPQSGAMDPGAAAEPSPPGDRADRGKTLLVVDDEAALRELEAQILRSQGFDVRQAGSVVEALQVAATVDPIHLLLTDYSLPDGDGFQIAHRFHALHPRAAILLVSGSVAELGGKADGLEHFAMLEKPFRFPELLGVIRAMLPNG